MSEPQTDQREGQHHQDSGDEYPLLLATRYNPAARNGQESVYDESVVSETVSTPKSHFSLGRLTRDVVNSLVPEPLRPRQQRVLQNRPPPLDLSPSRNFNASTEALNERSKYQVRPCSSVYDQNRPWPASTVCSEAAPLHEIDDDGVERGPDGLPWTGTHNERTWVSEPTAQMAPMSGGAKGKGYRHNPTLDTETRYWLPSKPLGQVVQPREEQPADETVLSEEEIEQQAVEREEQLVSQVSALRLPALSRRKQTALKAAASSYADTEPLLSGHNEHVPFDPVDPYHHSGQPKKKTLYGPEGYLGKKKEWKQNPLQKMVSKVGSVGTRVKNSIRRSLENNPKDHRAEFVYGIVMKPNISIHVARATQAEIYSKLELLMCVAGNEFLLEQLHYNRFATPDHAKRFFTAWKAKNRSMVPEFQFDLKTQYEIVVYNVRTFDFPSKYGLDPVLLKSALDAWGNIANQLTNRNFSWPDSAILKLFHDVFPVLELLGAPREFVDVFLQMRGLVVEIIEQSKKIKKVDKAVFEPQSPPVATVTRRGYHSG